MTNPIILIDSPDDAEVFDWQSDGWYQVRQRGTPQAEELFLKAKQCIHAGDNVPDVIQRLTDAGFQVKRVPKLIKFPLGDSS